MKAYKVNVNGNTYEITLEVIDKADIKTAPAPVAAPAPAQAAARVLAWQIAVLDWDRWDTPCALAP